MLRDIQQRASGEIQQRGSETFNEESRTPLTKGKLKGDAQGRRSRDALKGDARSSEESGGRRREEERRAETRRSKD